MLIRSLLSLLLLILALLVSCAPIPQKLVGEPMSQKFSNALVREWSQTSVQVVSVQGLAKVKVRTADDSLNGTQVILAGMTDRLRAETLSPFGTPLLLFASNGGALSVSLPSRNLFYTGAATVENIGRFVRIPLQMTDLVALLLYQPPLINAQSEEAFALNGDAWLVVRNGTQGRQELIFNQARQLTQVSYFDQDKLLMQISYGHFSDEGRAFPRFLNIELPEQKTTATLEFSELQVNGPLRPGIFRMSPPVGATLVSLDE